MSKSVREVVCLSNGTTNAIRYYLRIASISPDRFTLQDVLKWTKEFLKKDSKSKWLAHILYFLHLDLPEIENIKSVPGYFSLVNTDYDPIKPSYYIDAVFYLGLHEYFLQMVSTLSHLEFPRNLLTLATDRIVEDSTHGLLNMDFFIQEWLFYLTTVAQLCRVYPQDIFYKGICNKLLKTFIGLPYSAMPAFARVELFLRLAGIISLTKEDYEGNSEIADSIRELKFEPTFFPPTSGMNTVEAFQAMFQCQKVDPSTCLFGELVQRIGIYLEKIHFTKREKEDLLDVSQLPKKGQKLIHYIGDCAYLTSLIVKKNLPNLYIQSPIPHTTGLFYITDYMGKFKSKIRCEDYDTRNMKFSEFSHVLRSSKLKYTHHQTSWFQKFLNYQEALTTPEGYSLARDVIVPKADLQIGLEIVKKILRLYSPATPLDEELKEILLDLVITNENLNKEFDQIVNLLQKKEIHTGFSTTGFQTELNDVCSKLGADSCFDPKTQNLSQSTIRGCQRLTLQNPKVACQALLLRTMQLPKGGLEVLEALRCFWNLPVTTQDDDSVSNLFDYCLKEICILVTDDTMRNMQTKLAKFSPNLLRHNFITTDKFAAIIRSMIVAFNKAESNEKIGLLVDIYGSLVIFVMAEESSDKTNPSSQQQFIREAYYILSGLSIAATWSKAMDICSVRDKCLEICESLQKFRQFSLVKSDPDPVIGQKLDDLALVNKVFVYVRKSEYRGILQELIKDGQFVAQPDTLPSSKDIANFIRNTSPLEWDDLIDILYQVFLHFSKTENPNSTNNNISESLINYEELAFQQLFSILQKVPAFELPTVSQDPEDYGQEEDKKQKPTSSRKNRNPLPSVIYQRFSHHLVHSIERGHSVFQDFSHRHQEQYDLVYSFVSLIANYPDDREYHNVKQLTFISLLHLATWIVKSNPDYESKLKTRILECLEEVREDEEKGKHGSIFGSIVTVFKLTEPEAQSIISVDRAEAGEEAEETDQEIRLRFYNEDAARINQLTQEEEQQGGSSSRSKERYTFQDVLSFYKSVPMKILNLTEGKK